MEKNKQELTYENAKSVHIFAYPFIGMEKNLSKKFEAKGWLKKETNEKNEKQAFMLRQYLSINARKIFLEDGICKIYTYPLEEAKKPTYRIKLKEQEYNLPLKEIELHVYNDEVGILFIKVLNDGKKITVDDIIQINNKGRDIALPYIPDNAKGDIACAEQLGIVYGKDCTSHITDFRQRVEGYFADNADVKKQMEQPASFIQDIFNVRLGKINKEELQEDVRIKPTTDDRMYVMSIVRDDGLSEMIEKSDWTDTEEELLYKLIFVDDKGFATCQEQSMRKALLERSIYPRWREWGTIHAITDYSFMCMCSMDEGINASVIRPMYAEYMYSLSLVMAQKLQIMKYSEQAGELAEGMKKKTKLNYKAFVALRKQYVVFLNQLMITAFSCQQQGVELYDMLKEQMLVNKERELFDAQLEGLYEIANTCNGIKTTNIANFLAVLGVVLAIVQVCQSDWSEVQKLWEVITNAINSIP